jgi:16S rRNA (adenine1518-N6/adenine1519-N6)-dimethyltransferase
MPQKPKLGQNFLRDESAVERIVASLGDLSSRTVVEIGPGRGAITHRLAQRAHHLIAIELDRELTPALRNQYLGQQHIEILEQDVLTVDLTQLASAERLSIVGNLPYYITSDILLHLFAHHDVIEQAVLMVQREVADRVAATPGSRDYGLLSATAQMYGRVQRLFTLPPGAFSPPPDVHSTVFRLTMAPRFQELGVEETKFLGFLRTCFAQKRKTLANNLRAAGLAVKVINDAFAGAEIEPQIRAEALSLESMARLYRLIHN